MNTNASILVTGAAGFIGSCMAQYLNECGFENLILCDDFGVEQKRRNWEQKKFSAIVERHNLFEWLQQNARIDFVFHLGARTDTTEFDYAVHEELNVQFSKNMWQYCVEKNVPLVYASSAATYGSGEFGYNDDHESPFKLQPLNPYGVSKNEFDKWALQTSPQPAPQGEGGKPPFWAGLKFFNVYGPNEYHKGRMASVIFHSYNQIQKSGVVKLFKSHRPDFKDGEQLRDFVYVKDVVKVMMWMMETAVVNRESSTVNRESPESNSFTIHDSPLTTHHSLFTNGLYNLGTGTARSFYDLAAATFSGLDKEPNITFIDMPEDIRDKYQYFTEANMKKLRHAGYAEKFYSLEEGVDDYVRNYLSQDKIW